MDFKLNGAFVGVAGDGGFVVLVLGRRTSRPVVVRITSRRVSTTLAMMMRALSIGSRRRKRRSSAAAALVGGRHWIASLIAAVGVGLLLLVGLLLVGRTILSDGQRLDKFVMI